MTICTRHGLQILHTKFSNMNMIFHYLKLHAAPDFLTKPYDHCPLKVPLSWLTGCVHDHTAPHSAVGTVEFVLPSDNLSKKTLKRSLLLDGTNSTSKVLPL